jgi:hypothetical protein
MKIKYIVMPTIVTCLALGSTSCYGNNSGKSSQLDGNNAEIATTYSPNSNGSSPNYTNKYSNGSTSSSALPSTNSKGSSYTNYSNTTSYNSGGQNCSTMDFSVFEEADEEHVYNNHGFTRGDIKNLYAYKYDPKSEQTIKGTVAKILRVQFPDNNCYLIAVVNTDKGDVLTNLGPVWFIDENNLVVNEGDQIEITGSVIRTNGRYILIAGQFKKGNQSLVLRNQSGNPQWGSPKAQKGTQKSGN